MSTRASHDAPRSKSERRPAVLREQDPSTFTAILDRLVRATPGAEAAALVDWEGECIDYAGRLDTFELKVSAAHWLIVLAETRETKHLTSVRELRVRAKKRSFYVRQVHEGYALVVVLHRHAAFTTSERALREADAALAREAGWDGHEERVTWFSITVETHTDRTRPRRVKVSGDWKEVEVLGAVVGLRAGEKGFRVRLSSGHEVMLVKERLGLWFADERVE